MVVKRLAKLELAVVIVYVLAVLYRCLVARQSLADLYMTEQQSIPMMLLYMCLDMVQLHIAKDRIDAIAGYIIRIKNVVRQQYER